MLEGVCAPLIDCVKEAVEDLDDRGRLDDAAHLFDRIRALRASYGRADNTGSV